MRKLAVLLVAAGLYGQPAFAETADVAEERDDQRVEAPQPSPMEIELAQLQSRWAIVKYQMPDEEKQEEAIAILANQAQQMVQKYPGQAEPLIWQGIVLATQAGIDGGLGALGEAKAAKAALEAAEKINPRALHGSVYTSLGSLYAKVPGWPLGFGDSDKAKSYFEKALAINPNGIDPNFFFGEYLYNHGEYARARAVLEHGLKAPMRPGRELADKGRAEEIRDLLVKVQKEIKG